MFNHPMRDLLLYDYLRKGMLLWPTDKTSFAQFFCLRRRCFQFSITEEDGICVFMGFSTFIQHFFLSYVDHKEQQIIPWVKRVPI